MTQRDIIVIPPATPEWADAPPPPGLFEGVAFRRILAYLVDVLAVAALAVATWVATGLLGIISFGLLMPLQALAVALVPLAYHSLLIAAPGSATVGMRLMGLRVLSIADGMQGNGGRPNFFQAIIQTVAFYGSVTITGSLVLVVALFNPRRRTLHDWLAGTVVVNVKAWQTVSA